jgi:F-type H+-transporting ATPase subunit b
MHVIENIALISINETLVVQLISFLIFLFIINRIMIRPLRETMAERDNHIQRVKQDILDSREALETIVAASREEEKEIRREALAVAAEMENLAKTEAQGILGAARDDIIAQKRQAQVEIENRLAESMQSLKKEAETLSVSVMEKVLNRKVAS